jgi:hypothetical protein
MPRLTVATSTAHRETADATGGDVLAASQSLQGDGEVWLGDPTGTGLGFAGGPRRYLVAFVNSDEQVLLQAVAADPPDEDAVAVTGGQESTLPAANLVTLDVALAAATYFLAALAPDPNVKWQRL